MTIITIMMVGLGLVLVRTMWQHRSAAYIRTYTFDASVHRRLKKKYPLLTPGQLAYIMDGLRDYFDVCRRAGRRPVSMPSQAVDEAWHAFIISTRNYQSFCDRAYKRYLHHHPAEVMSSPQQPVEGIQRAWRLACQRESINHRTPHRLPRLFAIDASLAIPGGFSYSLDCSLGNSPGSFCTTNIGCGTDSGGGGHGGHGNSGCSSSGCSSSGCSGSCGGGCGS